MSGSHLFGKTDEIIEHVFKKENAAVKVEGLKQWLENLHVLNEQDAFLRVQDPETEEIYLIKKVGK